MNQTRRVTPKSINIGGQIRPLDGARPAGLSPVLAKFWKFARKMAEQFSKQLEKNREEEFLKVVRKEFDKDKRR